MRSPFPGMDPYLEDPAFWADFHHTFVGCWREAIADVLPESYEARVDETVQLVQMSEETRKGRIHILHRPERTVVAILEMLSPANKAGEGFMDYCAKRVAILRQNVHLIELDLLVGGHRLPLKEPLPAGDYYALISRSDRRPDCAVYTWALRQPLPTIPIPLRSPDADLSINLGSVFQKAYERGRYARSLVYGRRPVAPLRKEDRDWAVGLIPSR